MKRGLPECRMNEIQGFGELSAQNLDVSGSVVLSHVLIKILLE